jgi:hypothetical protein
MNKSNKLLIYYLLVLLFTFFSFYRLNLIKLELKRCLIGDNNILMK